MRFHLRDMDNVIRVKKIKGVASCYILFCQFENIKANS